MCTSPVRSWRLLGESRVDDELGSGDVARRIRGEEHRRVRDVGRFDPRHRQRLRAAITWAASSAVGLAKSGRNRRNVASVSMLAVPTAPGCTVFTRIRCGPSSLAKVRASPTTACLLAV